LPTSAELRSLSPRAVSMALAAAITLLIILALLGLGAAPERRLPGGIPVLLELAPDKEAAPTATKRKTETQPQPKPKRPTADPRRTRRLSPLADAEGGRRPDRLQDGGRLPGRGLRRTCQLPPGQPPRPRRRPGCLAIPGPPAQAQRQAFARHLGPDPHRIYGEL